MGRDELWKRADEFARGYWTTLSHWMELITSARNAHRTPPAPAAMRTEEEERTRRGIVAQERVLLGQVSGARQALTGAALAPRTLLEELRRKRPQSQVQPMPPDVMEFIPETPVEVQRHFGVRPEPLQALVGARTKCFRCVWTMSGCCRC